jgi:DnaJ-class molecular chaperone
MLCLGMVKLVGEYLFTSSKDENSSNSPKSKLKNIDLAYSILGVRCYTPMSEVRKAYLKLMKECHPDKYGDRDILLKIEMEEKTKLLNWAYNEIKAIA